MGRACLCSNKDSFVFLPYDTLLPPKACFFHSGTSGWRPKLPLKSAAKNRFSSAQKRKSLALYSATHTCLHITHVHMDAHYMPYSTCCHWINPGFAYVLWNIVHLCFPLCLSHLPSFFGERALRHCCPLK